MIAIEVGGRLIAIDEDDERARYPSVERLRVSHPACTDHWIVRSARALVEVQRQHGGLAPRALVGGEFVVGAGTETAFEVLAGRDFETLTAASGPDTPAPRFPGRLHQSWPFIAGLPEEFAPAVLRGLADEGSCSVGLPPGVLLVDRSGFDEQESSSVVFELAARMLRCVLAVKLQGGDVETEIRGLVHTW